MTNMPLPMAPTHCTSAHAVKRARCEDLRAENQRLKAIIATFAHGSTEALQEHKFHEDGKPARYLIDVACEVLDLEQSRDKQGYLMLIPKEPS